MTQDKRTEEERLLDDYAERIRLQPDDVLYIRLLLARARKSGAVAERGRIDAALRGVIAACEDDLATGHVPSSYCPDARRRECVALLSVLRDEAPAPPPASLSPPAPVATAPTAGEIEAALQELGEAVGRTARFRPDLWFDADRYTRAAAAWSTISAALAPERVAPAWTTTPPTAPGWYWFRDRSGPRIVQVSHSAGALEVLEVMDECEKKLTRCAGGEWCGPLEVPK